MNALVSIAKSEKKMYYIFNITIAIKVCHVNAACVQKGLYTKALLAELIIKLALTSELRVFSTILRESVVGKVTSLKTSYVFLYKSLWLPNYKYKTNLLFFCTCIFSIDK